jgi:hypothetical protein
MATKKARILVDTVIDGIGYEPNQVIDAEDKIVNDLVSAGYADDKRAAVKYCIDEEGTKPIMHMAAEPGSAQE